MLRISESQIFKGIISIGFGNVIRFILGFLCVSIAVRFVPQEDLGVYFLIYSIVLLLDVISGFGLRTCSVKYIASACSDQDRRVVVNNVLTFKLLSIFAACIVVLVAKPVFSHFFSSSLLTSLLLYLPLLFCFHSADVQLDHIMQGYKLYGKMALVRILTGIFNFTLVLVFLIVLKLGVQGYILAAIISLACSTTLRYCMIPNSKKLAFDFRLLRQLMRFGLPLQGSDILTFISLRLDVLILGAFATPAAVAYLAISQKVPATLEGLFNSLYSVYLPHTSDLFSKGQVTEAEEVLNRFLRLTSFAAIFGALVVVLFRHQIIVLLFTQKYLASAPALGLLMIILTISVTAMILDYTLIAAGHSDYLPIISLADAIPSVLANLVLIPLLGFMGAVLAKLIANIVAFPVTVWCLRREKIGVRVREYLKPMLFLIISLAVYFGLAKDTIALKGLTIIIFLSLCIRFSVIRKRDLANLANFLRSLRIPSRGPSPVK